MSVVKFSDIYNPERRPVEFISRLLRGPSVSARTGETVTHYSRIIDIAVLAFPCIPAFLYIYRHLRKRSRTSSMITLSSIQKRFGTKVLYNGISASFNPGPPHQLIGPERLRKTLLLRAIAGEASIDAGTIPSRHRTCVWATFRRKWNSTMMLLPCAWCSPPSGTCSKRTKRSAGCSRPAPVILPRSRPRCGSNILKK